MSNVNEERPTRPWLKWVIIGAIVLVVLGVGGPWAYINLGSSDAPAPLALTPSGTAASTPRGTTGTSGAASPIDGTWKVTDGSQAGYRITETLLGQSTVAVGRTTKVTGDATVSNGTLTEAELTVDVASITSDKSQRDGQFNGRIMETSKFPTATFKLTEPVALAVPDDGGTTTFTVTGDLTMHGTTKPVTLELTGQREGSNLKVSGSTEIVFADYKINNPSGGPATVGDAGTMEFLVVLTA